MKKLIRIVIAIITLLVLAVPAMAADGPYTKMLTAFTVDPKQTGQLLERGSTIHHLSTGVTEVTGADKSLKFKALDSEASLVSTPYGRWKATHVYHVPNYSKIFYGNKTTLIYDGDSLILTIINDDSQQQVIPTLPDWLAQTTSPGLTITYFYGSWQVPAHPITQNLVDFYFNGIESDAQTTLLQPVLQWNQAGYSNQWSIQSWALWPNGGISTGPVSVVSQGEQIYGVTDHPSGDEWDINTWSSGGGSSHIAIYGVLGTTNLKALCALEGGLTDGQNEDLPGSVSFTGMVFHNNGVDVPITWQQYIPQHQYNLSINYDTSSAGSWVNINTPY